MGGRKKFNEGAIDDRIQAVDSFSERIGDDPNPATIKLEVDATYIGLSNARNAQTGGKGKNDSTDAETTGNDCMDLQFGDCGILMNKFLKTPLLPERFFDRQLLSSNLQMKFTATMKGVEIKALSQRSVLADDEFRFTLNSDGTGVVTATLYLSSTEGGMDSNPILIMNHLEHKGVFEEFGDLDLSIHRHITVVINSLKKPAKILFQYY